MAHQVGAYPSFCEKQLGAFLPPPPRHSGWDTSLSQGCACPLQALEPRSLDTSGGHVDGSHLFIFRISLVLQIIIWLSPRAGKMTQIARYDWLPERARWSHLARSGLPAVPHHIINPYIDQVCSVKMAGYFFCDCMDLDFVLVHKHAKRNLANIQPS